MLKRLSLFFIISLCLITISCNDPIGNDEADHSQKQPTIDNQKDITPENNIANQDAISLRTRINAPEHWNYQEHRTGYGELIIDANIIIPDTTDIFSCEAKPSSFSNDTIVSLISSLSKEPYYLGNDQFNSEDLAKSIFIRNSIKGGMEFSIRDDTGAFLWVEHTNQYNDYFKYNKTDVHSSSWCAESISINPDEYNSSFEQLNIKPRDAIDAVCLIFSDLGEFTIQEIVYNLRTDETSPANDHPSYYIRLSRTTNGIPIGYRMEPIAKMGVGANQLWWQHEWISAGIDDDGIFMLEWRSPISLQESQQSINLLDFKTAMESLVNALYSQQQMLANLVIDSISLDTIIVQNPDSNEGSVTPVWSFSYIEKGDNTAYTVNTTQNTIAINAITGQLIK